MEQGQYPEQGHPGVESLCGTGSPWSRAFVHVRAWIQRRAISALWKSLSQQRAQLTALLAPVGPAVGCLLMAEGPSLTPVLG